MPRLPPLASGCLALLVALPGALAALSPARADYNRLAAHRLASPTPLPPGGLEWRIDVAHWTLAAGTVRLQEAVLGSSTGLWFEGRGHVELAIPDEVERRQLRRLLDEPDLDSLALDFDRMLVRSSGGPPQSLSPAPAEGVSTEAAFEARHEHYLEIRRLDVDAQVLAALGQPGALFWQADIHTADYDWVTFTYDSRRPEEISVEWFDGAHSFLESWLSFDRAADRAPDGRPSSRVAPSFDILHVDIRGDLTQVSRKHSSSIDGGFKTRIDLEMLVEGSSVLPFVLHPLAEVSAVTGEGGAALEFIRDHIGARTTALTKELYDASLLVLLPAPLERGARLSLEIAYVLRLPKYAAGRDWYPAGADGGGLQDSHTARLELVTDDRYDLQSMGSLVEEREADHQKATVWEIAQPVRMATFTMQKQLYAEDVERDGMPPLTVAGDIGDPDSGLNEQRISLVGVDTANALEYLQQLLAMPLPRTHFYAVLIPSGHGQAFEGFLHLGEFTAVLDTPAAVERFRAHEAGHQWCGHIVGWNSYRDQWLSEGFAEYMALMFVHDTVENGPKIFQQAITAYSNEVQGSIKTAFSTFARPGLALLTARGSQRVGPIGHGWRAAIGETPTAYQTLAYYKGALVLHMLRTMTSQMTGSDEAFVAILRDFVKTNAGREATTEDFRAAVERQVPADWSWFFDEWVYGAEIPTYAWDYEVASRAGGGATLLLTVEQRDVSPGFKMLVPVEVEFGKEETGRLAVYVDQPLETFELELPARPRRVIFNPGDAVLATVKKR